MIIMALVLNFTPQDGTQAPQRSGHSDVRQGLDEILARPSEPTAGDVLYRGLKKFQGKPQQYAFDVLGYPDGKMVVAGAVVYRWDNRSVNVDGGALSCTVKVIVRNGRIVSTDFNGNNGACARFARAVDPGFRARY